ncbi:hypothetical protein Droror1_Dr00021819 [Drosera rotundifolia]
MRSKCVSNCYVELFGKKGKNADRMHLSEKLLQLVGSEDEKNASDFVRVFVLLVCNCVLFQKSTMSTHRSLFVYVDNVEKIGQFAWGQAVFDFLVECISNHIQMKGSGNYFDGCVIALLASSLFCF